MVFGGLGKSIRGEEHGDGHNVKKKKKVGLWQNGQFFEILTAVLCDGNSVSRLVQVSSVWYLGAWESP